MKYVSNGWGIGHPDHKGLMFCILAPTKREAIRCYCYGTEQKWPPLYKQGFRAVRVYRMVEP